MNVSSDIKIFEAGAEESLTSELIDKEAEKQYKKKKPFIRRPAITKKTRENREIKKANNIDHIKQGIDKTIFEKKATAIIKKRDEKKKKIDKLKEEKERKLNENIETYKNLNEKKKERKLDKDEKKIYNRVKESSERKEENETQKKELEKFELNRELKKAKKEGKKLTSEELKTAKEKAEQKAEKTMDEIKTNRARKRLKYDDSKRKKVLDKIDKGTNYVPGMKSIKKVAQRKGDSLQRKRETWSKMKADEKFDFIIGMIRKYLLKPILVLIVLVIILTIAKYLRGLYMKYPRAFTITNFLDISSKYDRSTGLDNELAETLGKALADYVCLPNNIIKDMETAGDDTKISPYMGYIKENLFNKFNINNNNRLHKLLRNFINHKDEIFNSRNISINTSRYKKGNNFKDEYDNKHFKEYLQKMEGLDNKQINEYLTEYYKNIIYKNPDYVYSNVKLDTKPIIDFVNNLKNKRSDNFDLEIENKSIEDIINEFKNILQTKSVNTDYNNNIKEVFKNIFLRNVLYYIINQNSSIISRHLLDLENNNLLSYIDPNIYNNRYDNSIELFKRYGKYLYLKKDNSDDIVTFNEITKEIPQIESMPTRISTHYKNPFSFTTPDEIDIDIKNNIKESIETYDLEDIKNKLFSRLRNYKRNNNDNFNYDAEYTEYKTALENIKTKNSKGKGYDTGNAVLNDLFSGNTGNKIDDKFNINKGNEKDKSILEIYNILFMIEKLISNIGNNFNGIYHDKYTNYLYYIEKFTTLKYYNTDKNKYEFIFNENQKKPFINYFIEIQEDLLYIRDKDIINTTLFITLIFYNTTENTEKLLNISKFFMSFTELKLADNFINDVKQYKEKRTGYNMFNDYILPKVKYLSYDIIIKKYLLEGWDIIKIREIAKPFGSKIIKKITNECLWFTTSLERNIMGVKNCNREGLVVEHMFGFLKGLTKLPGLFMKVPKMLEGFINLIAKIFEFIFSLQKIILNINRLGLNGTVMLIIKTIFYVSVLIASTFLYFPFAFLWALPFFMVASARTWILNRGTIFTILFLHFIWIMSALFIDLPIIDVIGVLVYSIILLIVTTFKSIFILIIIVVLLIIGLAILPLDSMCNGAISRFIYRRFVACENSPFAWYKNSRYDLENKCSRGFFCNLNCGTNYKLSDNGMYCEKAPTNVPYYCPQPLLYKSYKDDRINGRKSILSFFINDYPNILMSSPDKQAEFIMNYQKDKSEYYQTCNTFSNGDGDSNKKGYNVIGKAVCASAYNIKDKNIKNNIKDICQQTYCSNGKYENFCYKYDPIENKTNYFKFLENDNKKIEFLKKTFFVIILSTLIIYTIYLLEKVKKGEILITNKANNMQEQIFTKL